MYPAAPSRIAHQAGRDALRRRARVILAQVQAGGNPAEEIHRAKTTPDFRVRYLDGTWVAPNGPRSVATRLPKTLSADTGGDDVAEGVGTHAGRRDAAPFWLTTPPASEMRGAVDKAWTSPAALDSALTETGLSVSS